MTRYLLMAMLALLLACSCSSGGGGGGNSGGTGDVVSFSAGCGERAVQCPGARMKWSKTQKEGIPYTDCGWDCAMYFGDEPVTDMPERTIGHGSDGAGLYGATFIQNTDGCWELDTFIRLMPGPSC